MQVAPTEDEQERQSGHDTANYDGPIDASISRLRPRLVRRQL